MPRPLRLGDGRGVPSNPSVPSCSPRPPTHKVRSLGMWLKLDTGMEVMLLLFRVLRKAEGGSSGGARWFRRHQPLGQRHTPTPHFRVDGWRGEGGHVGWGLQLPPGHLQDLQAPQGTEGTILDAADLVLVQLPTGESSRSIAGTAQSRRLAPRTAHCPADPKCLRASLCPALLPLTGS